MSPLPSPRRYRVLPRALRVCVAAAIGAGLGACTTRNVTEIEIGEVEILPAAPAVTEGLTVQLNATVNDHRGAAIAQAIVAWSSDNETIAIVDENGQVTGRRAGSTMIRATYRGVTGTAPVTVDPGPSIVARPESVTLFGAQGSSPHAEVVIENGGVATLEGLQAGVSYEGDASGWLPVSLTGTTAPATLTMTAATGSLAIGAYHAVVSLTAVAGNSPLELPVTLVVTEHEPIISPTPQSLVIDGISGRAPTEPVVVQIENAGGGTLTDLSTSVWYLGSNAGWLSASVASPTAPTELSVLADARGLVPGTYLGEVRVASPVAVNDPEAIPITFVVAQPPEVADVSISTQGPLTAASGETIEYITTVRNDGPDPARVLVVTGSIPAGTSFVSSTAGSYADGALTWEVGTLSAGSARTVRLSVGIGGDVTGELTYNATASSTTADPVLENNAASTTTTAVPPPSADVFVTKSAPTSAQAGSRVTYAVSVGNAGPDAATAVVVVDTLPVGTTFVSSTAGAHAAGIVTWIVGPLAGGAIRQIDIVVDIGVAVAGRLTNRVHASSDTVDPEPGNNVAAASTDVSPLPDADLIVGVTAPASANAGSEIAVRLTVENAGPADAPSATLEATLPAGVSFLSATGGGSHAGGVVTWTLGTLGAGDETRSFDVVVRIGEGTSGNIVHTASVSAATLDPDPSDNSASATTLVIGSGQADVSVTVTGPSSARPGAFVRYDVTVTNHGPAKARQVEVANVIPDQSSFVFTTNGKHSNGIVTWKHKSISNGSSFTTSVYVSVDGSASGVLTNTAAANGDTVDPFQPNNTGSATTVVTP
ncbi:MAG TPA: Ig-like domain-containing protein [Longimicrobiales bacterium]|nr:Ig-like domain-containing protein [Longimicrobiales bacterium]